MDEVDDNRFQNPGRFCCPSFRLIACWFGEKGMLDSRTSSRVWRESHWLFALVTPTGIGGGGIRSLEMDRSNGDSKISADCEPMTVVGVMQRFVSFFRVAFFEAGADREREPLATRIGAPNSA